MVGLFEEPTGQLVSPDVTDVFGPKFPKNINLNLPDKPSELIAMALADLERCERHPMYRINMHRWHTPEDGLCNVCLAGAVMSRRLTSDQFGIVGLDMFDRDTSVKLLAIDLCRSGNLNAVINTLEIPAPSLRARQTFRVPPYENDPGGFHTALRNMATHLRIYGL